MVQAPAARVEIVSFLVLCSWFLAESDGGLGDPALGHGDFIEIALPKSPSIQITRNEEQRTGNDDKPLIGTDLH
jgi:hypothetical protein